ncbi:MAG: asparagine synthase (glutamine-hydrolyzing) [Deltaproteobacteria bacterium]|nr:asparagine synthase (glutamine-hydrolyzing) [Deltaproteobacteria bacterium]
MCGIAGILGRLSKDRDLMGSMLATMIHRGPDEGGIFQDNPVSLGHRRLSIIDLKTGKQPISNEDKSVWVVANGEIFNYIEIKKNLVEKGHRFYTNSDIEVLPHLLEEYGLDLFEHLNGQFAFALWNSKTSELILARDRFGIAPLFYTRQADNLIFSSEIKAMLPVVGRLEIDPMALKQVFTFWNVLAPRTIFKGIQQLRPGECMVIRDSSINSFIYWDMTFPPQGEHDIADEKDAKQGIRDILESSVDIRLRADVPVGAYLSGGLDSSILASLVKTHAPSMETFSVSFGDPAYDESRFQLTMGRLLGTRHHVRTISYRDIGRSFKDVMWHAETPLLRTAPTPMYLLSELTHEHGIRVVLTGEGSDEVFGGYDIFKETKIRRFWARDPSSHLRPLLLFRLYPYSPVNMRQTGRMLMSFYRNDLSMLDHFGYSHLPTWRNTASLQSYFSEDIRGSMMEYDPIEELSLSLPEEFAFWDPLNKAQYLEIKILLAGYLLSSQGERMSMAHSVEGRYPYLDHRLVEFANRIDPRLKLKGLKEKYILKRAFAEILPDDIFRRIKQPYGAPNKESFFDGSKLTPHIAKNLERDSIEARGVFKPEMVTRLIDKCSRSNRLGFRDNSAFIGILSTQLLMDEFC